jgi:hypothetical protein
LSSLAAPWRRGMPASRHTSATDRLGAGGQALASLLVGALVHQDGPLQPQIPPRPAPSPLAAARPWQKCSLSYFGKEKDKFPQQFIA